MFAVKLPKNMECAVEAGALEFVTFVPYDALEPYSTKSLLQVTSESHVTVAFVWVALAATLERMGADEEL